MKTFDEAFKSVIDKAITQPEVFKANMRSADRIRNGDLWSEYISQRAFAVIQTSADAAPRGIAATLAAICAELHSAFDMGMLTGIEMEKPNEKE